MIHVCEHCLYCFTTLKGHLYIQKLDGVVGLGEDGSARQYSTLPEDIIPSPFKKVKSLDLRDVTYDSIKKCFEYLRTPLATERTKLLQIYRGVKTRINLSCLLKRMGRKGNQIFHSTAVVCIPIFEWCKKNRYNGKLFSKHGRRVWEGRIRLEIKTSCQYENWSFIILSAYWPRLEERFKICRS